MDATLSRLELRIRKGVTVSLEMIAQVDLLVGLGLNELMRIHHFVLCLPVEDTKE